MMHARLLLFVALVAATGVPGAAAAAPTTRPCSPRPHEVVVARSSQAVALLRGQRVLTGCSLATGRRRHVASVIGGYSSIRDVLLRGTTLAYIKREGDRYGTAEFLFRDDALHAHRHTRIAIDFISAVALGPGGAVAYVTSNSGGGYSLLVDRPGPELRRFDTGERLDHLRFVGTRLTWAHAGRPASAPIAPPDACAAGRGFGTPELDVVAMGTSLTGCWRATGQTMAITGLTLRRRAFAGSWLAAATDQDTIIILDVLTGAAETIAAPNAQSIVLDAHGSVAWLAQRVISERQTLWAHDSAGTRQLDADLYVIGIGIDDSTVVWAGKHATLTP